MKDSWELSISRARAALGLAADQALDSLTFSVFLKYLLLLHLEGEALSIESFRRLPPGQRKQQLAKIADLAGEKIHAGLRLARERIADDERFRVPRAVLDKKADDPRYLGRAAQTAVEQYTSERVAPELCLAPAAFSTDDTSRALTGAVDYVVLFESFPNFTNELYPLIIDAYESDLRDSTSIAVNVVGAHISWWNDSGSVSRGIFLRHEDHRLIEADLEVPRLPSALHCLCMSAKSHALVSKRASRLKITDLAPYEPFAYAADDKFECFRYWNAAGLLTPDAILLHRASADAGAVVAAAQSRWRKESPAAGMVIQPNRGTEGLGAAYLPPGTSPEAALEVVRSTWETDDALVRKEIQGMRFRQIRPSPPGKRDRNAPFPLEGDGWGEEEETFACDLRVNVSHDGERWQAESGYLQVAGDPDSPITSAGRGGRIVKFSQGALRGLVLPGKGGGQSVSLSHQDWETIRETAIAAAAALPGEAAIAGVDIRLVAGRTGDRVGGWVLDANPRPAGFAHSEFLPAGTEEAEPGVSRELWKRLRAWSHGG